MKNEEQKCPRCSKLKDIKEFRRDPKRKSGRFPYCKQCQDTRKLHLTHSSGGFRQKYIRSESVREYRHRQAKKHYSLNDKVCTACSVKAGQQVRVLKKFFREDKSNHGGLSHNCMKCEVGMSLELYEKIQEEWPKYLDYE